MPTDLESDLASLTSTKGDAEGRGRRVPKLFGSEMDVQAPIWKLYKKVAVHRDSRILHTWNSSIDTLLIFAALFSAVVTAFIIESYKLMQPDYAELTFKLLASNTAHRVDIVPFHVSASARSVNCLWITSLIFSLSTSLVGILIKHWLAEYDGMVQEESMMWCARRQNRYDNLVRWRLPEIVLGLPVLLHASLFLFLAGLVIFLSPLDRSTASLGLMLTIVVSSSYSAATLLPIFWVDCPYGTPVTDQLARLLFHLRALFPSNWSDTLGCAVPQFYIKDWFSPHSKSLACAFEWLVNAAPSTLSHKIYCEVETALSDMDYGPELCHHLPHFVQRATDSFQFRIGMFEERDYLVREISGLFQELDLAFRLAFNQAAFSYRKARFGDNWTDIGYWYRDHHVADVESPASIVALCYLRERRTHEATYHRLQIEYNESFQTLLGKLPVSSHTVVFIARCLTRSSWNTPWRSAQDSAGNQNARTGLESVLAMLCTWQGFFHWDDPLIGELLFSWTPRDSDRARQPFTGYHTIPLLCRMLTSEWPPMTQKSGPWIRSLDCPHNLVELLQLLCMSRLHSSDVAPTKYSEVVNVFANVLPFRRSGANWTAERVEAILDAALVDPCDVEAVHMIKNLLELRVSKHAPGVRDRCVRMVLQLVQVPYTDALHVPLPSRSNVIHSLAHLRVLAMLRDHSRINEILTAFLLALQETNGDVNLTAFLDCGYKTKVDEWFAPKAIAALIRQHYMDGRTSELQRICAVVVSLAKRNCFESFGTAMARIIWEDCVQHEAVRPGGLVVDEAETERDIIMGEFLIGIRGCQAAKQDWVFTQSIIHDAAVFPQYPTSPSLAAPLVRDSNECISSCRTSLARVSMPPGRGPRKPRIVSHKEGLASTS